MYPTNGTFGFVSLGGGGKPAKTSTDELMDKAQQVAALIPRREIKKLVRGLRGAVVNPCKDTNGVVCARTENDAVLQQEPVVGAVGLKYSEQAARFGAELVSRLALALEQGRRQPRLTANLREVALIGVKGSPNLVWVVQPVQGGQTWVVFRGTGNLHEWMIDLDAKQVPWHDDHRDAALLHDGFKSLYNQVHSPLLSVLQQHMGAGPLFIVGHSLGAALAIVCASYLTGVSRDMRVYSFAPPRVGNEAFVNAVQRLPHISELFPIANQTDMVPTMPLAVHPNMKNPEHPWLYKQFPLWTFYANWGSWERNHLLNVYKAHLHDLSAPVRTNT